MRLLILGATGGIGRHLLKIGLGRGHSLTAYVRSPEKVAERHEALRVIKGDLFCPGTLARAIEGNDAVLSAFGPRTIRTTTLRRDFGRTLTAALTESGVTRVQLVSAAFLFENAGGLGALLKPTLFRFMAPDMAAMERELMKEGLQWTVLRPPRLTSGPPTGAYRVADGALPAGSSYAVSRADVADFMIREAEAPKWVRRVVGIAG
ncbi:MAG TPA: SDR family oxidoreductase [Tepidisphaeraceae bacterium]|jgi:putative NADH-flavin reductase|nr:SDR family oxidoreductase [Tepidisphaeraceae bacterium]